MAEPFYITSLPDDVLLSIFEFCDFRTLCRLARTCRKFQDVINGSDCLWHRKSRYVLGSNMSHPDMQKRCKPILSALQKCQLTRSWRHGLAGTKKVIKYNRCLPWLYLEANTVYVSRGPEMSRILRGIDGDALPETERHFKPAAVDITKFTMNRNEAVVAFTNGLLGRWRIRDVRFIGCFKAHKKEIFSVDAKDDIIISGSRDNSIKIWKTSSTKTVEKKEILMNIRVLSTAIMPSKSHFIAGLPGTNDIHPLQMFDLERGDHVVNCGQSFRNGAGILHIYPENPNTFLCGGYDTTVRLWDIRCPEICVKKWMDPYDNSIYCVSSDHNVTIVSGANRNGVVHVWDKRHPTCRHIFQDCNNSPVYAVSFDASHIFATLQDNLVQYAFA